MQMLFLRESDEIKNTFVLCTEMLLIMKRGSYHKHEIVMALQQTGARGKPLFGYMKRKYTNIILAKGWKRKKGLHLDRKNNWSTYIVKI